jgi:hypothetical protein
MRLSPHARAPTAPVPYVIIGIRPNLNRLQQGDAGQVVAIRSSGRGRRRIELALNDPVQQLEINDTRRVLYRRHVEAREKLS